MRLARPRIPDHLLKRPRPADRRPKYIRLAEEQARAALLPKPDPTDETPKPATKPQRPRPPPPTGPDDRRFFGINKIPVPLTEEEIELRAKIRAMASTETPVAAIGRVLKLEGSADRIKRRFPKEIAGGRDYVYAELSLMLVEAARKGDLRAALIWMRQYGGWTPTTRQEITGKNGEPIVLRNLDTDSLVQVLKALGTQSVRNRDFGRTRPPLTLDGPPATDLDALSGTTDESIDN